MMNVNPTVVKRAMAGDRGAYGELVTNCWTSLVHLARGVVGDADAEDAVQDALVIAGERLGQLRQPESFPAWVRRLVFRTCLRRQRRQSAWYRLPFLRDGALPGDMSSASVDTGSVPDLDSAIDIERMLAVLPARQRAVLYLTAVEGCSDGEIGELLTISPGTVRSLRRHARNRLQKRFASLFTARLPVRQAHAQSSQEGVPR